MKASKFSLRGPAVRTPRRRSFLKQGDDGVPVAEICRKAGISQATYFNWRKKYAGLLPDEMRRLKAFEDKNSRLEKIVADLTLDREMLRGKSSAESSEACPEAEADGMLVDWGISIRRACKVRQFDTSTYHYKSRRTEQPPSNDASRRFARRACGMATAASMCICAEMDGRST